MAGQERVLPHLSAQVPLARLEGLGVSEIEGKSVLAGMLFIPISDVVLLLVLAY